MVELISYAKTSLQLVFTRSPLRLQHISPRRIPRLFIRTLRWGETFEMGATLGRVLGLLWTMNTHLRFHTRAQAHTRFHAWLFRGVADGWVSKVFVSTDARRALPSWCNRQHGGRVSQRYRFESRRGQWALFSSYRQLYLLSFSDMLRPTQRRSLQMLDVAVRRSWSVFMHDCFAV